MSAHSPHTTAHNLRGWVTAEFIPYKGKKLGPYYVRRWKQNGKLHRQYIKPAELEQTKEACENHRQKRQSQTLCSKEIATIAGNLNYMLTMIKRSIKGLLRPEDHDHLAILEIQGPNVPGRPTLRLPNRSIACPGDVPHSQLRQAHKNKPTRDFMVPFIANQTTKPNPEIPCSNQEPANGNPADMSAEAPGRRRTEQPQDPLFIAMLAQLPSSQGAKPAQGLHQIDLSQAQPKRKVVYLWDWIPNPWENPDPNEKPFYNRIERSLSNEDPNLIIEHRTRARDRRSSKPPPGWRPDPDARKPWDY